MNTELTKAIKEKYIPQWLRKLRPRLDQIAMALDLPKDHVDQILHRAATSNRRNITRPIILRNLHFRPEFQKW